MKNSPQEFIQEKVKEIQNEVGDRKAVVATSGGVDSTTCAVLAHKALGGGLTSIFIDDGLMREEEPQEVVKILRNQDLRVRLVKAQDSFFEALKGVRGPEEKRKVFRETFYKTLGEVVKEEGAQFLVQGTIAADVVETRGGIKTQHNVLEQIGIHPQKYGLSIIEPLKDLYKSEVREVAKALGLPKKIWNRMPFPGPGLALRVLGEVTRERVRLVRKATKIVEDELEDLKAFQAFAVLLGDKSTGVRKRKRLFGNIVVVRAVNSKDAMTAKPTRIPWRTLTKIQTTITREIPQVNRVVYDLTPKPPATIEYI